MHHTLSSYLEITHVQRLVQLRLDQPPAIKASKSEDSKGASPSVAGSGFAFLLCSLYLSGAGGSLAPAASSAVAASLCKQQAASQVRDTCSQVARAGQAAGICVLPMQVYSRLDNRPKLTVTPDIPSADAPAWP